MSVISNNQSFSTSASGSFVSALAPTFQAAMDSVLLGLGRDITIHLEPGKSPCTSSDCIYNSFYKRYMGANQKICEDCKGQGFIVEPRQTVYKANIRWTNEPYNESTRNIEEKFEPGRLKENFVRTKTVAVSYTHIINSIGATIDGLNVELFQEPRYSGFGGNLYYVTAWWKLVNR